MDPIDEKDSLILALRNEIDDLKKQNKGIIASRDQLIDEKSERKFEELKSEHQDDAIIEGEQNVIDFTDNLFRMAIDKLEKNKRYRTIVEFYRVLYKATMDLYKATMDFEISDEMTQKLSDRVSECDTLLAKSQISHKDIKRLRRI
jgi:hypothetical protein